MYRLADDLGWDSKYMQPVHYTDSMGGTGWGEWVVIVFTSLLLS